MKELVIKILNKYIIPGGTGSIRAIDIPRIAEEIEQDHTIEWLKQIGVNPIEPIYWDTGNGYIELKELLKRYRAEVVQKGGRKDCCGADLQSQIKVAEEIIEKIAPFLRRLIEPRFDENETNDYVNGSYECNEALKAIQEWDNRISTEEAPEIFEGTRGKFNDLSIYK